MDVYLAGRGSRYLECTTGEPMPDAYRKAVARRLFSYYYLADSKGDLDELVSCYQRHVSCFLDSGAFSAFTRNEVIDVGKYTDWLLPWNHCFDIVAALDVIGDADASWASYEYMRKANVAHLVPCFHFGEPYSALERMVSECDYIAIGGVAQLGSGPKLSEWLDYIWTHYLTNKDGTPKIKAHGFAVTGLDAMLTYPWASVDSSSWIMQAATGTCCLLLGNKTIKVCFTETNASAKKVDGWHYDQLTKGHRVVVDRLLDEIGFTADNAKQHYGWRFAINATTYRRFEGMAAQRYFHTQQTIFT